MLAYSAASPAQSGSVAIYLLLLLIVIVAIIVLIISLVMMAAHKKKKENKDAMKLFEEIKKDGSENKK